MKLKIAVFLGALIAPFFVSANQCEVEQQTLQSLTADLTQAQALVDATQAAVDTQQAVVDDACAPPPPVITNWADALDPYIPAVGEMVLIPNTDITAVLLQNGGTDADVYLKTWASGLGISSWVGMSFDYNNGVARLIAPGGDGNGGANSVYRFDVASLTWHRDHDFAQPVSPFPDLVDADGDGQAECVGLVDGPVASHSYDGIVYVPTISASITLGTAGNRFNWDCYSKAVSHYQWKWLDSGQWQLMTDAAGAPIPSDSYVRSVYDAERDRVYYIGKTTGRLWELNPHTNERIELADVFPDTTGSTMTMLGRDVYYTTHNGGFYRFNVDAATGFVGPITQLLDYSQWYSKGWGLAGSGDLIVGWDGDRTFYHWDTTTNIGQEIIAAGSVPPPGSDERVYGKFIAVPGKPGVFMGISDNQGWILYRAF